MILQRSISDTSRHHQKTSHLVPSITLVSSMILSPVPPQPAHQRTCPFQQQLPSRRRAGVVEQAVVGVSRDTVPAQP